jgi:hypothetical protein
MRKLPLLLAVILLCCFLSSCVPEKKYESLKELDNGACLQWGSRTYSFYCAVPKDSLIGKQIAVIGDDKKHKVFEVNGYPKDQWIIEYYDVMMSVYALYKADDVTDVPSELQQK